MTINNKLYSIIFLLFAGVFVYLSSQKPIYNWDMIPYMGVTLEYQEKDIRKVHDQVYKTLQREVPPTIYGGLTADIEDRYECLVNVKTFEGELSFFRTKPLYTLFVFLFYVGGVPLVLSTLMPSIIASLFFLVIAYTWISRYLRKFLAGIITVAIAFVPIVGELAKYSTPDALSNMLLLLTLFLLAINGRKGWILVCLGLSVLARVDNAVFAMVVCGYIYLPGTKNVAVKAVAVILGGAICLMGIPMLFGDSAGWFTKFAFLFSIHDYIQHWRDLIYTLRTVPQYPIFIVICIVLALSKDKMIARMMKIIGVTVVIRLFLFPSLQERFFAAYEVTALIMLVYYLRGLSPALYKRVGVAGALNSK